MANAKARTNSRVQNFAQKGRFGDNRAAHVQDGEIVVPKKVWMADPSLAQHASQAISAMGADPRAYVVGHPANNINPRTGAREFALQYTDQGWIDPAAGYNAPIDFSTYNPGGGNQTAPDQSQASFQPPAAGTPKQANPNWGPAPGSDAYYAQRAAGWEGAPAQQAPSFGFGGQNEMSASVPNSGAKQPNVDWGFGSPTPTPSTNSQWGTPGNSAINQQIAQATGYGGQFGSGGFDSWINTQSPETQLRAAGILQNAGQANRITWGADPAASGGNGPAAGGAGTMPPLSYVDENGRVVTRTERPNIFGPNAQPIVQGPIIPGVTNPQYPIDGGVLRAGQVPLDFLDPNSGVTTYQAMARPKLTQVQNSDGTYTTVGTPLDPRYTWWDVRNGGTGDPYVAATPEWQAQQAMEGNGYAFQALVNAGYDPAKYISGYKPGMEGMLASGQGTGQGSRAKYTTDKATSIQRVAGGVIMTYPDGVILSDFGGQLTPVGNGLYKDVFGLYRDAQGYLVNADGSYIPLMGYPGSRGADLARAFGGDMATRIVNDAQMRMYGRIIGPDETLPWDMTADAGYGITAPGGAGAYGTGYPTTTTSGTTSTGTTTGQYGTGYPTTTGTPGTTTPTTTTPTQSGLGLTPGTANPYSMPYGYSSPIINILGGSNGSGSGSGTISPDILSLIASLNLGYGAGTYGTPYYQSQGVDTTGGGIQTTTPNSETVDFRPSFGY